MRILRIGLCLVIAFAVLAHGAVEVWSESIVEIGAAVLLLLWLSIALFHRHVRIEWHILNWPILGLCAIAGAQLLFGATLYPFLTRSELLVAVSSWIVFFLATQAFRSRSDLYGLAWFLMLFCFAVSLFAIAQYFTSGDELYWFRPIPGFKPFGPYVNRNHFAGFIELTLPIGLALLMLRGLRRDLVALTTLLTLVPASALVLSSSRAGIIGVLIEIGILVALRYRRRRPEKFRIGIIAVALVAAVALIAWVGASNAISRFAQAGRDGVSAGKRLAMTRGAVRIFLDHPVSGTGLGTLVAVYPKYETMYDGKLVDHVHDDYAEALAESGLLGGFCGVAFFYLLVKEARKTWSAEQGHFCRAFRAGGIAAVGGLMFHSLVDFNLHIFSNAVLFLLQAYIATAPVVSSGTFDEGVTLRGTSQRANAQQE